VVINAHEMQSDGHSSSERAESELLMDYLVLFSLHSFLDCPQVSPLVHLQNPDLHLLLLELLLLVPCFLECLLLLLETLLLLLGYLRVKISELLLVFLDEVDWME